MSFNKVGFTRHCLHEVVQSGGRPIITSSWPSITPQEKLRYIKGNEAIWIWHWFEAIGIGMLSSVYPVSVDKQKSSLEFDLLLKTC